MLKEEAVKLWILKGVFHENEIGTVEDVRNS